MRFIFFVIALCLSTSLSSAETSTQIAPEKEQAEEGKYAFLLPVNWTTTPKLNMVVTVPKGYQSIQPLSTFTDPNGSMIEFIPKGETADAWSEIITINKFIGSKISAKTLVDHMKRGLLSKVKGKVLSQSAADQKGYQEARLILEYANNGRTEVLGMVYNSGPYDCAGLQYTVRLLKGQPVSAAVEKVQEFLKNNATIVPFGTERTQ